MGLPGEMSVQLACRANMALSANTKSSYATVKNNIAKCERELQCNLAIPWDIRKTIHFVAYLLFMRKVKVSTVNYQLSGVRMAHLERGFDNPSLRTDLVNLLLKGTEHWDSIQEKLTGSKSRST